MSLRKSAAANAVRLNGGSIRDSGGNDADLTHEAVPDDPQRTSATPGPVHDAVATGPLWLPIVAGVVLKIWDTSEEVHVAMKTWSIVLTVLFAVSFSPTRTHAQVQSSGRANTASSETQRDPARVARGVPSARSVLLSPNIVAAPDYGTLLDELTSSPALLLWAAEQRKASDALADYARQVPAGQPIEVTLVFSGNQFRRLHVPNPQDPWDVVFLSPNERTATRSIRGANMQMARDLGYSCWNDTCYTPDDWDRLINVCSARGRSPDQVNDDCVAPERRPNQEDEQIRVAMNTGGAEAWEEAARSLISDTNATIDELVRNDSELAEKDFDPEIHAANMAGYRSSVYLAQTFIGFNNPELSRQIAVTGTAVLDIYDALATFRHLPPGASANLGAMAMSASLMSSGIMLAGAFMDAGPTADEIILEEIGKLRQQVGELRLEMHERFDGIHEHIDAVYADMIGGFEVLTARNRRSFDSVMNTLYNSRRQLTDIAGVQLDLQRLLLQQFEAITDLITNIETAYCLRPRPSLGDGVMTQDQFDNCYATIAVLHRTLPTAQLPPPSTLTTMETLLSARPDRTLSWDLMTFRRLLGASGPEAATRASALPDAVVGPEAWFGLMHLHDGFLATYSDLAAHSLQVTDTSAFATSMRVWRSDLVRYAEAIRREVRAFQEADRQTALSELFEEVWSPERFAELLRTIGDPLELMWSCMAGGGGTVDCEELVLLRSSGHVREALFAMEDFRRLEQTMSVARVALAALAGIGVSQWYRALRCGHGACSGLDRCS